MANNMIACRKSFTDTLLELARQDKDIVAVTTDARGSVTSEVFIRLYLIDYQSYKFYKIARVTNVQQKSEKLFPSYLTLL